MTTTIHRAVAATAAVAGRELSDVDQQKCTYCSHARDQIREFCERLAEWDIEHGTCGNYPPLPDVAAVETWIATPNGEVLGLCARHYKPFAAPAAKAVLA